MRMRARYILGGALAVGLLACGFSGVGAGELPGDNTTNVDGGSSSTSDASGDDGGSSVVVVGCDSGLVDPRLVILPPAGGACPSGTTEQTVHTAPRANADACTCGACTPTAEPTCAGANFTWTWGSSTSCTSGPANYDVTADNACITIFGNSTTIAAYNRWSRVPQGGTCTAAAVADGKKVTTTAIRQCVPNTNADVCAAVSAGQRACVPGDLDGGACGGKYPVSVVVGDGATVTCARCGCVRTASACNVEYHDTSDCSGTKKLERPADNSCIPTGTPSMRAIKVYPMNVTCAATPGAPTASLTNARALCCTR